MTLAVLATLLVPFPAHAATPRLTPIEHAFVRALNATRVRHGVGRLATDARLVRAARFHSSDMVRRDYFAHLTWNDRLRRFGVTGYGKVGENLGYDGNASSSVPELVRMWLASPDHRANLLDPRFRYVGVGVTRGAFARWSDALVVTTDFYGP